MNSFKLIITTPEKEKFSADAASLLVKTTEGDVQILAGHTDYFATLGTGRAKLQLPDGDVKFAACAGGIISVSRGEVRLLPTTFEFSYEIDVARAMRAKEKAEALIASAKEEKELAMAKAKLMRAISRLGVAEGKR
jgi:F-type H+-transporting ATPase subunit epsilon